ncbi:asparagine synthase (glutamine-hydrolyzing) [Amycolatopsis jiangsuensis]|uniref:asparagine synthase (glutamine-hydrolyzing) n=1 Tax=Amycolatopsis jiangsuensis TaxID=1181879 RepID=A0A840J4W5_9PSEU|nr:asparagine synthase (glutamine-hydrolyzing) [Amycolatopsis jiangsuensis]MBB4688769.1 asparagine synthase (glutamine-hydrolyzing) [Amycolatopsis jiangsuensis]
MCGITGWVAFERDLRREAGALAAMTATMACRGPDAGGTWVDPRGTAALGHRRLAVLDLAGSTQPMTLETPDGWVALTYSGEVYNYAELRAELRRRGHHFRTTGDTEVVLRGYVEWGDAVAERLNGMYAFAVWDGRTSALVLVRDRMGVKPLYYQSTSDGVVFGSEPKALLANPLADRAVRLDGLRELFAFVKTPGHAVWAGMREVRPGTVVTVGTRGTHERTYWSLETVEHRDDLETTTARVRDLLAEIVTRQLVADVPLGLLLSGGLDSSAVTAHAARELAGRGEKVHSFSVDFASQSESFVPDAARPTPDAPYVREVSAHVGTVHSEIVLDAAAMADPAVRRTVIAARDVPAGTGDTDVSLYLLFSAIRERSTVALSGESADEVFGGYHWHRSRDAQCSGTFPWMSPANGAPAGGQGRDGTVLRPELLELLDIPAYTRDRYAEAVAEVTHLPGDDEAARARRITSHLGITRFMRMLLDRKDRLSMAAGLEVRVPFCDHRLVEYVHNAPWAAKSFDGREKSLLRAATRELLPHSVATRVKSAYPSIQAVGYLSALCEQATELRSDRQHPVFDLISDRWLDRALRAPDAPGVRSGLERCLNLAAWLDLRRPRLLLT